MFLRNRRQHTCMSKNFINKLLYKKYLFCSIKITEFFDLSNLLGGYNIKTNATGWGADLENMTYGQMIGNISYDADTNWRLSQRLELHIGYKINTIFKILCAELYI